MKRADTFPAVNIAIVVLFVGMTTLNLPLVTGTTVSNLAAGILISIEEIESATVPFIRVVSETFGFEQAAAASVATAAKNNAFCFIFIKLKLNPNIAAKI